VDCKTLDDILEATKPGQIDFVSIDVEGLQLNVLRGFNLSQYRPGLLLVEDHLVNLQTHRHMCRNGYRLVKRTARNNWYVPEGCAFPFCTALERFLLWKKIWLHTPIRKLRIWISSIIVTSK
jgi:hypothetical protein